jgi:CheY-like chemotaxis protein
MKAVKVLLVEDNPADADLTRETLEEGGHRVDLTVADDGAEALDLLRGDDGGEHALNPDVILLDLNLPRLDGRKVLSKIKSDPKLKRIPVIVMTSSRAESDILSSYELGANCYVAKPVDLAGFQRAVRSLENFWFCAANLPSHGPEDWPGRST